MQCTLQGPASWRGKYYQYRITVFCPDSQQVETLTTTDPYSLSLAADGTHTQVSCHCSILMVHVYSSPLGDAIFDSNRFVLGMAGWGVSEEGCCVGCVLVEILCDASDVHVLQHTSAASGHQNLS